jgi:hypothetical protein
MQWTLLLVLAACGDNVAAPHHPACIVGRDCPDAAIDAYLDDAHYPACSDPVPSIQPCTCADWLCRELDGGLTLVGACGPQCDAGVDAP